ncbi:CEP68 protein, partial [Leiothrix lutea]|nr:CEP68 protein [Leiothrix lutea]
ASPRQSSSVPMAVDVGKSPSEESLSGNAEGDGRWDGADTESDFPELAGSLQRLLGTEEAKPGPQGTESVALSRHMAAGVTQGGSGCHPEASSASGFPRARAKPSGKGVLVDGAADGRRVGHCFLSSEEEQQVRALGCWDPVSSPPSWCSSPEENILAGSRHDARVGLRRQSLGAPSPCPSTPELLRPQSPPSPGSAPRSLSAPSSRGNNPSEEPAGSLAASTDVPSPSPAATTGVPSPSPAAARAVCCRWGAEGRALQRREPPGPLLGYRSAVGRLREVSSYQADYWACAIPDSLPPSPDRSSPRWNPNQEYEDLLDYAYPLKPRYKLGRMPEPFLHDSGIGLESFSASPEGVSSSQKPSWENMESDGWIHRDPPRGLHLPAALRDTLDGLCLDEPQLKGHPKKSQQSESLIQCVKMFCCQLEELIHWLYTVVDVTGSWAPPSPDIQSLSASLHRYLEFRKDVADHRSLTESVLERGEALLDCMASNSPALRDTLALIAKQSEELESRAEHLYKSILAAVGQDRGAAAHGGSLG